MEASGTQAMGVALLCVVARCFLLIEGGNVEATIAIDFKNRRHQHQSFFGTLLP
jgi:hypothetical protein